MSAQQDKTFFEFIQHGLAGSIGAVLSILILFPIDNIKLRMQIDAKNAKTSHISLSQKVKEVYKKENIGGFYKGIIPTIIGNFISNFTYFLTYNYLKYWAADIDMNNNIRYITCTFIAGMATSVVTNPFWVIQTAQTNSKEELTIWQTAQKLGFKKCFKGLSASLILVLNPIINYFVYENLKVYTAQYQGGQYESIIFFLAGGCGKFLATLATYPYQLLRTQSHLQPEKVSMTQMSIKIYKQSGIIGLYQGLQAKLYQTVLNTAFTLMFYEKLFQYQLYIFQHIEDQQIAFGLKIFVIFLMILYIQSHKIEYTFIYYLFFVGFILSILGNLLYLLNIQDYDAISYGFLGLGLLFYIHSIIGSISNKKNRHALIYIFLAVFILGILGVIELWELYHHEINLQDIIGGGLIVTLFVVSLMRYGKTSKSSFSFTMLGAVCLALSARLMYIEEKHEIMQTYGVYFICAIQVLTLILLMLGTLSHSLYQGNSPKTSPKPQKNQKFNYKKGKVE